MFLSTGLLSVVLPFFSWGLFELAAKEEKWLHWTGTNDDILGKVILGLPLVISNPKVLWPLRHMVKEFVTNLPQFSSCFLGGHNLH